MLTNSNKEAAIVGFTETWLGNTTEKNGLKIEGYRQAACRDRTYNRWGGGGEAFFAHKNDPLEGGKTQKKKGPKTVGKREQGSRSTTKKTGGGGGVAVYVHENVPIEERKDLQHDDIEAVWEELSFPNSKHFLIFILKRTLVSLVDWYDNFTDMCDRAYLEEKEIIMIGDLNLDFLKPHDVPKNNYNILDKYHINQLINEPTRVQKNSKTCIDHIGN